MSMKDNLSRKQRQQIKLMDVYEKVKTLMDSCMSDLIQLDTFMHRALISRKLLDTVNEVLTPEETDEVKESADKYFEELNDMLKEWSTTGNSRTLISKMNNLLMEIKREETNINELGNISELDVKINENDIKITMIGFIKEYIKDDLFKEAEDPKSNLKHAMEQMNQMLGVNFIDTQWLEKVLNGLYKFDTIEERTKYLDGVNITLENKNKIRTADDVLVFKMIMETLKRIVNDDNSWTMKRSMISLIMNDALGKVPHSVMDETAKAMHDILETPHFDRPAITRELDKIIDKYTPDDGTIMKETMKDELVKGHMTITITDDKEENYD